jgi:hypothetical protein
MADIDISQTLLAPVRKAPPTAPPRRVWTVVLAGLGALLCALDVVVVATALPALQADFGASLSELEWTINAYNLVFACLTLTGAALGDRFGRRRMYVVGLAVFTLASAWAALAGGAGELIAARAVQGAGAAVLLPLTLTLISEAFPAEKRGVAIGLWGGVSGLGVAAGPVLGGAVTDGLSWQWIFWLNVPIGVAAVALAVARIDQSTGPSRPMDLPGLGLASMGLLGIVWALVQGNDLGWGAPGVAGPLILGPLLVTGFVLGTQNPVADDPHAILQQPRLRRRQRHLAAAVLRDVRIDLPARAIPAAREGLLGAGGRRSNPAMDGDAAGTRPARRIPLRSHRQPAARCGRHRVDGRCPRVARGDQQSHRLVLGTCYPLPDSRAWGCHYFSPRQQTRPCQRSTATTKESPPACSTPSAKSAPLSE